MKKSDLEALAFSVEKPRTDMWGDAVAGSVKGEFKRRCLLLDLGEVAAVPIQTTNFQERCAIVDAVMRRLV